MDNIVEIENLRKVYDGGPTGQFEALKGANLEIKQGEILALLGPNGAGKTTLISTVCGITRPTSGSIRVGGHDVVSDYRAARKMIGLVPQEINLEPFEKVIRTVRFSRGLFGLPANDAFLDEVLAKLSLVDKRENKIMELSGGMKRRVLIAKALAHEPKVLFLDEPSAGVDVELRKGMWDVVRELRDQGVTIILTTHYIEEAEQMADRVAVISKGQILLVEEKDALMARMGQKAMSIELTERITELPSQLSGYNLEITNGGAALSYTYDAKAERTGIRRLLNDLDAAGLTMSDLQTQQSSLEEIFVDLVQEDEA
ncbi:ABC transporter ATP-binding protein [Roseobacteraceae bacterium S113]